MTCFTRAVETGSFSAVARELGIGQPNVSRHVAALEQHLGSRLLHRSTRQLRLTAEGERYYGEARRVLDALAEAESNVRGQDKPSGLLRLACPTVLGRSQLLPRVKAFMDRYPDMALDLQISDRFVDLVEEGLDLAIRVGLLKDSSLLARRVGSAERVCVASPDYLARRGAPQKPADLVDHDCVLYTLLASGNSWEFQSGEVKVSGRFKVNTPEGIYRAVVDGLGVGYAPVWLFADALRAGQVQPLLRNEIGPPSPIHVVYPAKRFFPRRASVFVDYIADEFSRVSALNTGAVAELLG